MDDADDIVQESEAVEEGARDLLDLGNGQTMLRSLARGGEERLVEALEDDTNVVPVWSGVEAVIQKLDEAPRAFALLGVDVLQNDDLVDGRRREVGLGSVDLDGHGPGGRLVPTRPHRCVHAVA